MSYNPYNDIVTLMKNVKNSGGAGKTALSMLYGNNSLYRSTYSDTSKRVKQTADEIRTGEAYTDPAAQSIRAAYADYAASGAQHTAADAAADTSGELSSYAAAQANRTARDMLAAGEQAVADYAQQKVKAQLEADSNLIAADKNVAAALGDSADNAVELAKSENSTGVSALRALLNLYGIEEKLRG